MGEWSRTSTPTYAFMAWTQVILPTYFYLLVVIIRAIQEVVTSMAGT